MQLQFEKRGITCLSQALRGVREQELTQEVRLSEDMPDVGRIIAGWGQVILRGKEWQGSRASAAGGVQASVLYAPEDGTAPRMVDVWLPFQMKWEAREGQPEGPMRVQLLLRFVDGRNLSARKILVRAGIACLAEGLCSQEHEVFSPPAAMPEDLELLRRSYPVRLNREAGEKTFSLEETLDPGSQPIREILHYSLQPEVTECRVSGDKLVLRGNCRLHLLYRCPEGRLQTRDFEIPFSQLAELERGYDRDPQTDVMMAVTGLELDMEEEKLALKSSLVAQYVVSDRTMLELVEDAYSPRREVGLRQEELYLPVVLDDLRERISAQAAVPEPMTEVVDMTFLPGFPRTDREGDRVELTIPGRFQLLGHDAEGVLRAVSASWEGSTVLAADVSGRVDSCLGPMGEPQWITTGSGMELRCDGELQMTTVSRRGMPMLTSLELGEIREPDPQRPTLILCRRGKQGLWEVAKGCGASMAAIRQANGLEEEPDENRMLLIPVP